jgi:hypothetical protein
MTKTSSVLLKLFTVFFLLPNLLFAQDSAAPSQDFKLTIDKVDPSRFYQIAVIQGLNKTTAKTSILEMKIGDQIKFGQITITALKCWQSSLDQKPESKILLEVFENKIDENGQEKPKRIFYGWMFASSPSISGLEHPIYDLTALKCKNK